MRLCAKARTRPPPRPRAARARRARSSPHLLLRELALRRDLGRVEAVGDGGALGLLARGNLLELHERVHLLALVARAAVLLEHGRRASLAAADARAEGRAVLGADHLGRLALGLGGLGFGALGCLAARRAERRVGDLVLDVDLLERAVEERIVEFGRHFRALGVGPLQVSKASTLELVLASTL
jgi:hypothetical protein